ncbi:ATP-binding protein [Echinicola strongylocentroti]|uniref:ATP-binding protein n=1 Tax=Echinicola strongylocentroti TaxID=1795355 RepID=A0A2Z4IJS8_9BACT|nr:ATP-binding protein [Echinicola strongylocentroti]AWW30939.1 ATP-binding protein [Echinicola strongylocentroti]
MIQSFKIKNFKSYREAELTLAPLTVMIGANASGKSNAIEAVRFLSWIAQGQKLSSLQFEINKSDTAIRGKIGDLIHKGSSFFSIGCTVRDNKEDKIWNLAIDLAIRDNKEIHISKESIENQKNGEVLYKSTKPTDGPATEISVAYNNFARGGKKPQVICSDQLGIFTQLTRKGIFPTSHKTSRLKIPHVTQLTEGLLKSILFLDPSPQSMREYSFIDSNGLLGNGSNISAVLFQLIENNSDNKIALLSFIKSLPEQDISDIGFLKGPRGEVMLTLTETFGGDRREIDAGNLSDGTLRVLAIGAALLSAPENGMVIIEEIDNGVHPSRAEELLSNISETAKRRNLTILLSTHNPALMDAVPSSAIQDVVFCYRDKKDGTSKLISLKDVPDYPELIIQESLGDLVTKETLSRYVKSQENADEKVKKALNWLESIK